MVKRYELDLAVVRTGFEKDVRTGYGKDVKLDLIYTLDLVRWYKRFAVGILYLCLVPGCQSDRKTNRSGQPVRQKDKQTGRQTANQTDRQIVRH